MSGIAGVLRRDGDSAGAALEAMIDAIEHRGPDGLDTWTAGPVGLAHARLRTAPTTPDGIATDGAVVLTADARLDNRDELCGRLDVSPDAPDDALLAAAYDRWGRAFPRHLLGVFAVALWDARRHRLVCARDHVGVRPFYYHLDDDLFAFGTEAKAPLALGAVPDGVDERWLAAHLAGATLDYERTPHRAIQRLPPARTLVVTRAGSDRRRYWAPDPTRRLDLAGDRAFERRFRTLLTAAVRARLPPDERVGALLSGGLDSSSIACVARNCLDRPLRTYTWAFPSVPSADETAYSEAVLAQDCFVPAMVRADRVDPLVEADRRMAALDAPLPAGNTHLFWTTYAEAASQGVRVLFDGFGGDDVVSHGFVFLPWLLRRGRWIRLAREVPGVSRSFDDSLTHTLRSRVLGPLVPTAVRRAYISRRGGLVARASPFLEPAVADRTGLTDALRAAETTVRGTTPRERHAEGALGPRTVAILEIQDALAAAHGIVPRYPYFDRRLVAFCLALPFDQRLRGGTSRSIVRRSLRDTLPEAVRTRPGKTYLDANFARALHAAGDRIHATLCADDLAIGPLVDAEALCEAARTVRDAPGRERLTPLWLALSAERWFNSLDTM